MAKSGRGKDVKYWYLYILNAESDLTLTSRMYKEFPKLKSGEPQLKFHLKTLRMLGASLMEVGSERVKNNEKAQVYRNCGNDLFSSNGDPVKVTEMYTKSIAYALPGSRELSLAYANRSAVSFKAENYEECLLDIERSLETKYPEEMKAKLYARKVRCLVALKKPKPEIEEALENTRKALLKMELTAGGRDLVEKTLTDKNHMAPTISRKKVINRLKPTIQDDNCDIRGASGITIRYSKKYGRHIIATRHIRPGEIIAVIDTYAKSRSPDKCYRECAQCVEPTTVGISCDHCVNVIYCSTACRGKAWSDYHEIECPILGVLLDLEIPTSALLGIRITMKALQEAGGVAELKKMVKKIDSVSDPRVRGFTDNVLDCTKYACIYTLTSYAGNKKNTGDSYYMSLISTLTIYCLATLTEIFGQKCDKHLGIFDKNPLLIFLGELMIKNCEIVQMTGLREGEAGNDVTVAPFTALCNHSCDSNVTCLGDNKSIAFALQPIKAGEQVWDNYLCLHFSRFPKTKRQELLKRDYHFTCECVACVNNWPMLEKLPEAAETPGLPPSTRTLLLEAKNTFLQKYSVVMPTGNILDAKDELSRLLELIYTHACPSREIVTYREFLMTMYGAGLNPS